MLKKLFITLLVTSSTWAAKAPNFIVVYVDDFGWAQTSVEMLKGREDTKSDFYQTPTLERMAKTGQVLSACYSPSPICAASRNSMLHGMTPSRLGYTTLTYFEPEDGFRGKITIPEALKQANPEYVTAHFGKWHNDSIKPDEAGYDITDGNNGNGPGDYADDRKTHLPDEDPKRMISLTEKTKKFMRDQVEAEKPFFVQLSHYALHIWHDSFQATRDKYKKLPRPSKAENKDYLPEEDIPVAMRNHGWIINYAAMIEDLDASFGDLLDELDALDIADNTYVLFTSDNGGGFRGNKPLTGAKGNLLEGGIRMPSFVRGPGIKHGSYNNTPMVHWDFLQTFYDLAGGTEPLPAELDGGSLKDVWFNGDAGKVVRNTPELIFHFPWHTGDPESVVRVGDYKLLKDLDTLKFRLYNLKDDIGESKNLASQMPEKVAEMDKIRAQYLENVKAETVTDVRRKYLGQLEGGWIQAAEARLEKLKAAAAADPTNKQKAFHVDVSTNHVNFQAAQREKCLNRIKLHEDRGTADSN